MKKTLKFVNAIFFLLSLACLFLNIIRIAAWDFSGFKMLKLGFAGEVEDEWLQYILYYAQEYIQNFTILLVVVTSVALLGFIFSLFLSGQIAHIFSMLMGLVDLICVMFVYIGILTNVSQIDDVLSFLGADSLVEINHIAFIAWMAIYALIIILSIIGLFAKGKAKAAKKGDIYIEEFYEKKNVHKKNDVPNVVRHEQVKKETVKEAKEVKEVKAVKEEKVHREKIDPNFHGALRGKSVIYAGKVLLMEEKTKVFFVLDMGNVVTSKYKEDDAVAAVYFVSEYQEYCVEVMAKKNVYLASGQPLGAGRTYYLPRGTEIYLKDKKASFELA